MIITTSSRQLIINICTVYFKTAQIVVVEFTSSLPFESSKYSESEYEASHWHTIINVRQQFGTALSWNLIFPNFWGRADPNFTDLISSMGDQYFQLR